MCIIIIIHITSGWFFPDNLRKLTTSWIVTWHSSTKPWIKSISSTVNASFGLLGVAGHKLHMNNLSAIEIHPQNATWMPWCWPDKLDFVKLDAQYTYA